MDGYAISCARENNFMVNKGIFFILSTAGMFILVVCILICKDNYELLGHIQRTEETIEDKAQRILGGEKNKLKKVLDEEYQDNQKLFRALYEKNLKEN